MFYPDEIRSEAPLETKQEIQVNENEIKMATRLIESLITLFVAGKYTDDYRAELLQMIESKIAGDAVTLPQAQQPGKVIDLMEALKASLAMVEEDRKARRPTGD